MRRVRIPKPRRRRALPPGEMNKMELGYSNYLDPLVGHLLVEWRFEAIKLRLAKKTFYTPDFLVILFDGSMEFHEVKGHWEDDARVKIKVAAAEFPYFRFRAVMRNRGAWTFEDF